MSELDARKQSILHALVLEYVEAAEPVGSELLVHKYQLGVKSATVRNELAEMSELGYLEQPHTSAGRIPSDQGYRYYVDRLLLERDVDAQTKQKVRAVAAEGDALQSLLSDAARVLSRFTQLLTVAAITRNAGITVRSALVTALGPTQSLLVLVLDNGHVENRVIEVPPGLTLQDIGSANEALAATAAGQSLVSLAKTKVHSASGNNALDRFQNGLWTALKSLARDLTRGKLVIEGEEYIFTKPEFQRDVAPISELFQNFLGSDEVYAALRPSSSGTTDVVRIGRENQDERLRPFSIVRSSFFVGEREAGVIALIGPTRMQYDRSIPLVSFTAKALSDSLTKFFG